MLLVLILGAVAVGLLLPDRVRVERRTVIQRPVATAFTVLDGFRHFREWSPWTRLDTAMQVRVEGPVTGVGARVVWESGEATVGSGSQEITEAVPYERIVSSLTFSGMQAQTRSQFDLRPVDGGTEVIWILESALGWDLVGRYFGLMHERLWGPDLERGLAQLKAHVESLPAADFAGLNVDKVEVAGLSIAYMAGRSSTDPRDIALAYEKAYARVNAALARDGVTPGTDMLAIGRRWDADARIYEFEAALPVPAGTLPPRTDSQVKLGRTYEGTVLRTVHRGAPEELGPNLQKLMAYKQAMGYESNGSPWDVYRKSEPSGERVTETYVPVK